MPTTPAPPSSTRSWDTRAGFAPSSAPGRLWMCDNAIGSPRSMCQNARNLSAFAIAPNPIDGSFISGPGTEANKGEIVKAMLGRAGPLDLITAGEGIETQKRHSH